MGFFTSASEENSLLKPVLVQPLEGGVARFYFPRCGLTNTNIANVNAVVPMVFASNCNLGGWTFYITSNQTSSAGYGGQIVRGFIYEADENLNPTVLVADLGAVAVLPTNTATSEYSNWTKINRGQVKTNLETTVSLQAGKTYLVGAFIQALVASPTAAFGVQVNLVGGDEPFSSSGVLESQLNNLSGTSISSLMINDLYGWFTDYYNDELPEDLTGTTNVTFAGTYSLRLGLKVWV